MKKLCLFVVICCLHISFDWRELNAEEEPPRKRVRFEDFDFEDDNNLLFDVDALQQESSDESENAENPESQEEPEEIDFFSPFQEPDQPELPSPPVYAPLVFPDFSGMIGENEEEETDPELSDGWESDKENRNPNQR